VHHRQGSWGLSLRREDEGGGREGKAPPVSREGIFPMLTRLRKIMPICVVLKGGRG